MLQDVLDRLLTLPAEWVYGTIGILAAVENVFPPVPADTAVAIGAFLSAGGVITAWNVFLITWISNVLSASLVYGTARTAGRAFFRGRVGQRLLRPSALARIERLYDAHGLWAIFLSRFVPAVRAVVPPFAGVAGLDPWRALAPMAVASAIWYGALTWIAATAIGNVDEIARLIGGINRGVFIAGGVVLVMLALGLLLRRRRAGRGQACK